MTRQSDEEAIWRTIIAQHVAYWMRDFAGIEATFVHSPDVRWWANVGGQGATLTNGWAGYAHTAHVDIANDPERNPLFAYRVRFENRMIRVSGDLAYATFTVVFPTGDMPGFHGPDIGHQMFVLERVGGEWLILGVFVLDDQFGQSAVPFWQIDEEGRVLRRNPAATRYVESEPDSELRLRGGRLHLGDAEIDKRFHEAIRDAAGAAWGGVMATSVAIPVVFDPGNDLPAHVWWAGRKGTVLYVALNDPSLIAARIERAATAFGLSPSQRRLTASIVSGIPLTDAAKQEGVRISTARTQLQRIFTKVGVRTQPALVRALLAVTGPS